jgi:hypothetical protein
VGNRFARVVLGAHIVSDVLAGITLGIGWVAVTTWSTSRGGVRPGSQSSGRPMWAPPSRPYHGADLPVSPTADKRVN